MTAPATMQLRAVKTKRLHLGRTTMSDQPYFPISGGSYDGYDEAQGTSHADTRQNNAWNPEGIRELPLGKRENQAAAEALVCFECGIDFACTEAFLDHMTNHITGNPEGIREQPLGQPENQAADTTLVCFECGIAFASAEAFHNHMNNHITGIPEETWEAASYHELNPAQSITLVCHLCGIPFKDMDTLQKHNAYHENLESFPCHSGHTTLAAMETCRPLLEIPGGRTDAIQGASSAGTRQDSERVSEESAEAQRYQLGNQASNTTHVCSLCGFAFPSVEALQNHTVDHMAGKNIPCHECGKLLRNQHEVIQHSAVHKGEESFSCGLCGRKFTMRRYRTRHMNRMHKDA